MNADRSNLVAPCGIDCGLCELYLARDNDQLFSALVGKGIPSHLIPCDGCRTIEGDCPVIAGKCATHECVTENELDFCFECDSFPCVMFNPARDKADILPHNLKVFNLGVIERLGLEEFIERSGTIREFYFNGNMVIGKGPELKEQ